MFENITAAPADPILGLADLFRADDRPEKINLGIGVYKDETGKNARSDQRQKSRAVSAGK
ncbi:Aspartate aminotransferase [Klebsiella pneumoniae IS43]|uniref:Aspartate aminotransferase n=1 Tax=Klebsiella pneumoniae IS43 TaxID=1432552 RepID=W1DLG7_KLEPN|nr:Aspartate aminotransferase [Klebsiella pneumoniae IS43]CDL63439.1 Aspartate aminotransferase [Klebsiella pneumoniae IS39]